MSENQAFVPEGAESFSAPTTGETAPTAEDGPTPELPSVEPATETNNAENTAEAVTPPTTAPPSLEVPPSLVAPTDQSEEERLRRYLAPSVKLGRGAHKTVYAHPTNEHLAVAVYRNKEVLPPPFAERFYTRKLMHLMYPKNCPDIHLSTSEPELIVLDRVTPEKESPLVRWMRAATDPIRRNLLARDMRRNLGLWIDNNSVNFMRDARGNLVYVDEPTNRLDVRPFDRPKMEAALKRRLKGEDLRRAITYLDRIAFTQRRSRADAKDDRSV